MGVPQTEVPAVGRRFAVILETGEQHARGFYATCFGRTPGFQTAMERLAGFVGTPQLTIVRQTALVRQTGVQCAAAQLSAFVFGTAVIDARSVHIVRMPCAHFTARRGFVAVLFKAGSQRMTRLLRTGVLTAALHDAIFIKLARRPVAFLPTGGRFRTLLGQARLKRLMRLRATNLGSAPGFHTFAEKPGCVVFTLLATSGRLIALIRDTRAERLLGYRCARIRTATVGDAVLERLVSLNEAPLLTIRRRVRNINPDGPRPFRRCRSTNGTLRRLNRLN